MPHTQALPIAPGEAANTMRELVAWAETEGPRIERELQAWAIATETRHRQAMADIAAMAAP